MRLSTSETQTLIGPLVVGGLLGAFCAYSVFAFASEAVPQGEDAPNWWPPAVAAVMAVLGAIGGAVGLLGVLPIVFQRLRSRGSSDNV